MTTIGLDEATGHLRHLVERAQAGEEIVILDGGQPVARLVGARRAEGHRRPGSARGLVRLPPDFDAPMPEAFRAAFGP